MNKTFLTILLILGVIFGAMTVGANIVQPTPAENLQSRNFGPQRIDAIYPSRLMTGQWATFINRYGQHFPVFVSCRHDLSTGEIVDIEAVLPNMRHMTYFGQCIPEASPSPG